MTNPRSGYLNLPAMADYYYLLEREVEALRAVEEVARTFEVVPLMRNALAALDRVRDQNAKAKQGT